MAEEPYKEITKVGYGSRIMKSFQGILIGLLLFVVSFGVLYWNEGRTDFSKIAKDAKPISSQTLNTDANLEGALVSTMGTLRSAEKLDDGQYLQPGNYLALNRKVEMYAWKEVAESETKTNLGGSETTETTYTYEKDWTSMPADSNNFKVTEGHENPQLTIEDFSAKVSNGTIGSFSVNIKELQLPGSDDLTLTLQNTILPQGTEIREGGKYLYIETKNGIAKEESALDELFGNDGKKVATDDAITETKIGDVRISFSAVPSPLAEVTVIGKLSGNQIAPYYNKKGEKLYRAFNGTAESAVATLSKEYNITTWILRIVGFLMMWIGLGMILGPISVILDVLPFLGKVSRATLSLASFVVALVLSIVTIIISAVIHNVWALIIMLAVILGGGYYWYKSKKEDMGEKTDKGEKTADNVKKPKEEDKKPE